MSPNNTWAQLRTGTGTQSGCEILDFEDCGNSTGKGQPDPTLKLSCTEKEVGPETYSKRGHCLASHCLAFTSWTSGVHVELLCYYCLWLPHYLDYFTCSSSFKLFQLALVVHLFLSFCWLLLVCSWVSSWLVDGCCLQSLAISGYASSLDVHPFFISAMSISPVSCFGSNQLFNVR